jgi:DNA-binding NarL/FixJ family response regulator
MDTLTRKHVFIVEDSDALRARLVEMIGGMDGVSVVGAAASRDAAVVGIALAHPDYVVLDFQIKGGTGADVLRAVRDAVPQTVFIILTNHTEMQFRRTCMEAGANAFFDKTTEFHKVMDMIAGTPSISLPH